MERKKILLINMAGPNISFYMRQYEELMKGFGMDTEMLFMDREGLYNSKEGLYPFEAQIAYGQPGWQHVLKLLQFSSFTRKFIQDKGEEYHRIVVFRSLLCLMPLGLKKLRHKVILDVHDLHPLDYSPKWKFLVSWRLKPFLSKIKGIVISSEAFQDVLTERYELQKKPFACFYNTELYYSKLPESNPAAAKNIPFGILFSGQVRDKVILEELLEHIGNDNRFHLYIRALSLQKGRVEKLLEKYSNISYENASATDEELRELMPKIHAIHSIYSVEDENGRRLLPSKLAMALKFQRPILMSPASFMLEKGSYYGLAYALDLGGDVKAELLSLTEENIDFELAGKRFKNDLNDSCNNLIKLFL